MAHVAANARARRGTSAAASSTSVMLAVVVMLISFTGSAEAWLCNGYGRRFCRGTALQVTGCPEPCKKENCEDVKKSTKLKRRFGIVVDWEEVAESGLWDNVYVEDDEVCIATCYIDPLKAKCREKARYGGHSVCSVLNCDHDDRTRYAGCHTDHRREPYHRPTCKECGYLFPGCEGSSESDLADWEDTYWDAVRDSSAVPDDDRTAARNKRSDDDDDNDDDSDDGDNASSEESEDVSEDPPSDDDSSEEAEDSKEEEQESSVSEQKRDDDSDQNRNVSPSESSMPSCAKPTEPGETLKPDGSESSWADKYNDVSECFRKCTSEGEGYRYIIEDIDSGNCYCWKGGYTWSVDEEGRDRVYDVKGCSAIVSSDEASASDEEEQKSSSSDDDASTRRRRRYGEEGADGKVSIEAGRQPSEKPPLKDDGAFVDYDYDYGEQYDLELDIEAPNNILGRDPFAKGDDPILYASLQFLVERAGESTVDSFQAKSFMKHISTIAGVAEEEVQLLTVESEAERMCMNANRNASECVQRVAVGHSTQEELLTVSFVIAPVAASASGVQTHLETLASTGELKRTLRDVGFNALDYSLDSAIVDRSGALVVSESSVAGESDAIPKRGGSSAGVYSVAGVLAAAAVAVGVAAVVYLKISSGSWAQASDADMEKTLALNEKVSSESRGSQGGEEQQTDTAIGTNL